MLKGEIQKPDLDLLIYSGYKTLDYPIIICSLKTSLRERGGQTYKWKLLMDIALSNDCDSIKRKYDVQYHKKVQFITGFITTDFYNEIDRPQQRGMIKFFDFVYVTKRLLESKKSADSIGTTAQSFSKFIETLKTIYPSNLDRNDQTIRKSS